MRKTKVNEEYPMRVLGPAEDNYFVPPHGGRPPSDEAVRSATQRYIAEEKANTQKREAK